MTGRPGGAPFRFWGAARSLLEVSAQKARRREQPIARLLTPSLTRLTQDSCCAATSELTQDSWTHYRTLHPDRRATDAIEQRACHRVRSHIRTECGRSTRIGARCVERACVLCERARSCCRFMSPFARSRAMHGTIACRYELVSCPRCALLAVAQACGVVSSPIRCWTKFSNPEKEDSVRCRSLGIARCLRTHLDSFGLTQFVARNPA